jgi:hypothetical protein
MKNPYRPQNILYCRDLLGLLRAPREPGAFAYRDVLPKKTVIGKYSKHWSSLQGTYTTMHLCRVLDQEQRQKPSGTAGCLPGGPYN